VTMGTDVPADAAEAAPPLRVLIVDDEDLARARLRSLVADCAQPLSTVVGEAANAAQALAWLQANRQGCDVALLDIRMPGRDGLQLAAELRQASDAPAVVFVTAHGEHALKAFELEALDYLTKPVRRERLHAALQRVAQRLPGRAATADTPPAPPAAPPQEAPVIIVSDRGRVLRVPVAEVLYLKAELKYVTLRTASHTYVLDDALSDLELRLGPLFMRVHRNALVARHAVRALERRLTPGSDEESGESWAVRVAPVDEWLAVSRRQASAVREALAAGGL